MQLLVSGLGRRAVIRYASTPAARTRERRSRSGADAPDVDPAYRRAIVVVTLTYVGRDQLAAQTPHGQRPHRPDDTKRAAIADAPPTLFQMAEHLVEPADGGAAER